MAAEPTARGTRRSLRIGPYAVEAPLALGPLGSAYRATDVEAGRPVALKVLPPELAGSLAARDRFQREAKRATRVRSPHAVRVLDFGDASGTWFLALELVEGPSLAEVVQRRGTLDGAAVRDVVTQAARALSLLHREGLVPRDLSAGNFVVARGPDVRGRVAVKLLDLGLLRPGGEDTPDVRTALAALGATACFLLTGRAGGKPDLGSLSGDVADDFRAVLRRLIAQRPEERFPTPEALLEALGEGEEEEPEGPGESAESADPMAALAAAVGEGPPAREEAVSEKKSRRRDGEGQDEAGEPPPPRRRRGEEQEDDEGPEPAPARRPAPARGGGRKALLWGVLAFVAVMALGAVVIAYLYGTDGRPRDNREARNNDPPKKAPDDGAADDPDKKVPDKPKDDPANPNDPPPPPALYQPREAIDWDGLRKDCTGPWADPPQAPADAPVFRVMRVPPAGAGPGPTFDSVAAACAAVPEGKWGVVEISDNGPLFEAPVKVSGRNVVLRGARGYAPLIVWDLAPARAESKPGKPGAAPPKEDVRAFLTVEKGTLRLDNVSLAVDWPERVAGTGCLVRVADGDFVAWGSTFSVAGKPHGPFTAVRFEGGEGRKCGLAHCYARGTRLTALELTAPGADVMIDGSLFVGGESPLLAVAGGRGPDGATTLRVIRSTLLARQALLAVRPSPDTPADPSLHWLGWDALLWRAGEGAGGTMVDLPKEAGGKAITWRAVNCLYAGWKALLSGREPLAGSDVEAWHAYWNLSEGDVSLWQAWVVSLPADPAEALPWLYQTYRTAIGFAATSGPGVLGCDLGQLPWARPRWLDITTQRTRAADAEVLAPDAPLEIPKAEDGLYYGERLDLDKIDLGARLRDVQKKQKLAPTVVLHLHGAGKRTTSPVRVENVSLFLYFEPPEEGAEPLVLAPDPTAAPDGHALFEVTGGNLWMAGADVRCPDFKAALLPSYLVMVRGGNLFLSATRLQGPLAQPPNTYWGLIRVEGSGSAVPGAMYVASVNRCALLSSRVALHLAGAGLRAHLEQSLVVCTDRAVGIQPGLLEKPVPRYPTPPRSLMEKQFLHGEAHLNVQLTADHCTFAAREEAFFLDDVPVKLTPPDFFWPVVADPVLVQTKDCAFLNPFADKEGKAAPAALLAYTGVAAQRGLLCWQAEGNVYDKRLYAFAAAVGADGKPLRPEKPQAYATWERLWGPAERKPVLDVPLKATLDLEKLALDQLALPAHPALKEKPGADLARLTAARKGK